MQALFGEFPLAATLQNKSEDAFETSFVPHLQPPQSRTEDALERRFVPHLHLRNCVQMVPPCGPEPWAKMEREGS